MMSSDASLIGRHLSALCEERAAMASATVAAFSHRHEDQTIAHERESLHPSTDGVFPSGDFEGGNLSLTMSLHTEFEPACGGLVRHQRTRLGAKVAALLRPFFLGAFDRQRAFRRMSQTSRRR